MGEQNPTGFRVSRCSPGMTGRWSSSFQRKLESKSKAKIGNFVSEKHDEESRRLRTFALQRMLSIDKTLWGTW